MAYREATDKLAAALERAAVSVRSIEQHPDFDESTATEARRKTVELHKQSEAAA